jgi:phytoene dehydrogenase-like protein
MGGMSLQGEDHRSDWDVIVIGAGVGGLVCAAYLAAAGRRVVVLEQHDVAGGNGHAFRRRRVYQFDVGVHYLGDCGPDGVFPAILNGLGLRDRVRLLEMDPSGFDRIVTPSLTVDVPVGWQRYRRRLADALPHEANGITEFTRICENIADVCRRGLLGQRLEALGRRTSDLRWSRRSLAALFDHCRLSPVARTVLAGQSGNYGAAPRDVSVRTHAIITDHYLRGAYYPAGGGQTIIASLVEALEAHGGELWTRCAARRVSLDDGGVDGVELADGRRLSAPIVVSNADYRRTILELCDTEEGIPPNLVSRADTSTMRLPMAVLYLALDIDRPDLPNANVWWLSSDDIEASYARLEAGVGDEPPFLFISFASVRDSEPVCPAGHSNLQVMTLCPPGYGPWGVPGGPATGVRYRRRPGYLAAKHRLTEAMLDAAETAIGPLREHIVHLEMATPLTQERYTRSTGGTPYGLNSWGAPGGLPDRRPGVVTSVPGLYVVGQSTSFGSGITGVATSGIMCAGQIVGRPLLPEVHAGAVLSDPSLLPDRPAGWDPLAVSRGRERRHARGLARIAI